MKTIVEIASSLTRQIKPRLSKESDFNEIWLMDKIITTRAQVIKDLPDGKPIPPQFYSRIDFIELANEKSVTYGGEIFPLDSNMAITIPRPLAGIGEKDIRYVGSYKIGELEFERKGLNAYMSQRYARYTADDPIYTLDGIIIRLMNVPQGIGYITVMEIVEDPRDLENWDDDTSEFPLPEAFIPKLELLIKKDLFPNLGVPVDMLDDKVDRSQAVVEPQQQQPQQAK